MSLVSTKFFGLIYCILLTANTAFADEPVSDFLRVSESWLLSKPVIVTCEAVGAAAGITFAGFDPASGAWFFANQESAIGRDPQGVAYYVAGDAIQLDPAFSPLPYHIGTILPAAILAAIHEEPDVVQDVRKERKNWIVRYAVSHNNSSSTPVKVIFIAEFNEKNGRMIRHERDHETDRRAVDFEVSGNETVSEPQLGVLPGFRLSFEAIAEGGDFQQNNAVSRVRDASVRTQQRLTALAAGYTEDQPGVWIPPSGHAPSVPYVNQPVSRLRMPLVVGGALVVTIVLVEVVRRRSTR